MRTIYKYPLKPADEQQVEMPAGAEPLTVQMQDGILCMWATVPVTAPAGSPKRPWMKAVSVLIVGTGHPLPDEGVRYVGTVQDGPMVWHVFVKV